MIWGRKLDLWRWYIQIVYLSYISAVMWIIYFAIIRRWIATVRATLLKNEDTVFPIKAFALGRPPDEREDKKYHDESSIDRTELLFTFCTIYA